LLPEKLSALAGELVIIRAVPKVEAKRAKVMKLLEITLFI